MEDEGSVSQGWIGLREWLGFERKVLGLVGMKSVDIEVLAMGVVGREKLDIDGHCEGLWVDIEVLVMGVVDREKVDIDGHCEG